MLVWDSPPGNAAREEPKNPMSRSWGDRFRLASVGAALACLVAAPGCAKKETTAPIDSRVLVRPWERLEASGRTLVLDCETERIYGCVNHQLLSVDSRVGSAFGIVFLGVTMPDACLTALGPARARIDLGRIADGSYTLAMRVNERRVRATMDIGRDAIVVTGGESEWTHVPRPSLRRVPPGTLWGTIGWGPGDQSQAAQAFLDSMATRGAAARTLAAGDYHHFRVEPDGSIVTPLTGAFPFERGFALHDPGSDDALAGVLYAFAEPLRIWMTNDRGRSWTSWPPPVRSAGRD